MTSQRAMDGYGPEDMAIPEKKLIQNVGGTEAKLVGAVPGDFFDMITGQITKGDAGFNIVVVDIRKQRTYWGRTEIEDEPPICASADAKSNLQGEDCDTCPYGVRCDTPWLLEAAERRTKCLLNYTILAIDVETQLPALIRVTGISTQAVRELMTALRLNKQLRGEYHRALVHVTSMVKKTASGDAYAMSLRATQLISDSKMIEEMKDQSTQLLGVILLPEGQPAEETEEQEKIWPARVSDLRPSSPDLPTKETPKTPEATVAPRPTKGGPLFPGTIETKATPEPTETKATPGPTKATPEVSAAPSEIIDTEF